MATKREFIDFLLDQLKEAGNIKAKHMFGEYGLFSDDKIFALVCDNKLFIKPTDAGRAFIKNVVEAPPYPGAKNSFLIEEQIDDHIWLSELVTITVKELPAPKARKRKRKK